MKKYSFSIIVPCYNEQASIGTAIAKFDKVFKSLKNFEIIIVNDGSKDKTLSIIKRNKKRKIFKKIKVLNHKINKGYGAALKTGIRTAKYENIVTYDSDCSYPLEKIPEFTKILIKDNADMVVGARIGKSVSYSTLRSIPKWFLKKWICWIVKDDVPDINSGLRIFKKVSISKFMFILPNTFSFSMTITIAMMISGKHVIFKPINYQQRVLGKSKIKPIRDTLRFLRLILRTGLIFAPLRVLSPIIYFLSFLLLFTLYNDFQNSNISDKTVILFILTTGMTFFSTLCELIVKSSMRNN